MKTRRNAKNHHPFARWYRSGSSKTVLLVFWLVIVLALESGRLLADDDNVGYRHEFYREDGDRMNIDTDTAGFDIGLGEHVRLQGQLVQDAISGATPTGAPPQTQWPFQTFQGYYNQAYNQFFQAEISATNNYQLYSDGLFNTFPNPYQAYTNYIATNYPGLRNQATNIAVSQFQHQSTNANIHNATVPLTQLHDFRRAASLTVPITFGIQQFAPQLSISKEHDYHSYGMALNYSLQLNEKNTTLNAGLARNADRVRDNFLIWQGKYTDEFIIGLNQLLTPKSYFTVDFTYGQQYGYLSDPYRGVMPLLNYPQTDPNDAALLPDNRPRSKNEEILFISYDQYFEPPNGSMELQYRFYHDSYGIFAQTFDAAWNQKLGRRFIFTPDFRYYYQTAANFYYILVPDANNLPPAYSSDYRLSELETFNMSATLTYRVFKHLSVEASYARYIMHGLDRATSQSAYPSANVYTVGGRIWF